ncbi:MAG: hypothetical protein JXB47_15325 [Anaerolineae bacterium]|nr:hypothetical protein [Anaerolineae bacterium]
MSGRPAGASLQARCRREPVGSQTGKAVNVEENRLTWLKIMAPLFPPWARLGHPIFQWELAWRQRSRGRFDRLVERSIGVLWAAVILVMSVVVIVARAQGEPLAANIGGGVWLLLWAPHLALRVTAGLSTAEAVNREVEAGTWASLCVTAIDVRDLLGAKWSAGLWSLRGLWGGLTAFRGVLVALLLFDFAQFRGQYLTFLVDSSLPPVPWVAGLIAVAMGMAAGLMQPLVTAGADAAFGVFVSAHMRSRALARLVAAVTPLMAWIILAALLWPAVQNLGWQPVTTPDGWLLVLVFSITADMGLGLLSMTWLVQLYGGVDWGFLIGPAALLWLVGQALLAGGFLRLAGRQARRLAGGGQE